MLMIATVFSFFSFLCVSQLNDLVDDTLWTGVPGNYTDPNAPYALAVVRKLVDGEKFVDATEAASGLFGGPTEVCVCVC